MGRDIRYIPPHSLQHVTDVTFQNRRFLRPSKDVNERLIGILGRAQKKYDKLNCLNLRPLIKVRQDAA